MAEATHPQLLRMRDTCSLRRKGHNGREQGTERGSSSPPGAVSLSHKARVQPTVRQTVLILFPMPSNKLINKNKNPPSQKGRGLLVQRGVQARGGRRAARDEEGDAQAVGRGSPAPPAQAAATAPRAAGGRGNGACAPHSLSPPTNQSAQRRRGGRGLRGGVAAQGGPVAAR